MNSPSNEFELITRLRKVKLEPIKKTNSFLRSQSSSSIHSVQEKNSLQDSEENTKLSSGYPKQGFPLLKKISKDNIHYNGIRSLPKKLLSPSNRFPHISFSTKNSSTKTNNSAILLNHNYVSLSSLYENYLNINDTPNPPNINGKKENHKSQKYILNKLYKNNSDYNNKEKQIKKNNYITERDDFNLKSYQDMLIDFTSIKASREYVLNMRNNLINLRKKCGMKGDDEKHFKTKCRWDLMLDKLGNNIPFVLIQKLKSLKECKYQALEKEHQKLNKFNSKYSYLNERRIRNKQAHIKLNNTTEEPNCILEETENEKVINCIL